MSMVITVYLQITAIFIIMSWALYLPFKSGQFYNGCVYCMSIGAYFSAIMVIKFGWPVWIAVVGSVVVAMLFALVTAPKLAQVGGFAMVIATIAIIFIVQAVARNTKYLGGLTGLYGIPIVNGLLPVSYAVLILIGVLIHRIEHSRMGRAMDAVRTDMELAVSMGINPIRLSILLQAIAGALGGLGGSLYSFTMGFIRPMDFGFNVLLYTWTMLFVGGHQTMWGIVISAPLLWALTQFLPSEAAQYTNIVFGVILAAILILRPEGIITKKLLRRLIKSY